MPKIYVGKWKWNVATVERREHWSSPYPDKTLGLFDLRSYSQAGTAGGTPGWGFFVLSEAVIDPNMFYITDKLDSITDQQKTVLKDRLGLGSDLASTTMGDAIFEIIDKIFPEFQNRDFFKLGGYGTLERKKVDK